jgi:hypothetical protein
MNFDDMIENQEMVTLLTSLDKKRFDDKNQGIESLKILENLHEFVITPKTVDELLLGIKTLKEIRGIRFDETDFILPQKEQIIKDNISEDNLQLEAFDS